MPRTSLCTRQSLVTAADHTESSVGVLSNACWIVSNRSTLSSRYSTRGKQTDFSKLLYKSSTILIMSYLTEVVQFFHPDPHRQTFIACAALFGDSGNCSGSLPVAGLGLLMPPHAIPIPQDIQHMLYSKGSPIKRQIQRAAATPSSLIVGPLYT